MLSTSRPSEGERCRLPKNRDGSGSAQNIKSEIGDRLRLPEPIFASLEARTFPQTIMGADHLLAGRRVSRICQTDGPPLRVCHAAAP